MAISETIPTYRQLNRHGFFCPEAYIIEEGEAFEFDGEPNEHMEALNEPARSKLLEFYKKLDEAAEATAKKNGRAFTGRSRDLDVLISEATADARRVSTRDGDGGIPLMSAKIKGDAHVKKVHLDSAEPILRRNAGRPRKAVA